MEIIKLISKINLHLLEIDQVLINWFETWEMGMVCLLQNLWDFTKLIGMMTWSGKLCTLLELYNMVPNWNSWSSMYLDWVGNHFYTTAKCLQSQCVICCFYNLF